ncbi:PREDICTED: uncharacterized protein LOC106333807 [Brassica oleracea var. oleracea]|uniref:uncharacterized protein LOC106333807 n=1 Tax=Brassica oleracea var. oleracea TaxID=109376 RepID=UPI0006A71854|nr:PREDICTED: uncharacterized protein LOC106333807 [Brassica oleracea var. oleracea]
MHVFDQASSCYDRWGKAIDRGFLQWLGYNQKCIGGDGALLEGAGALLEGAGALLDGDGALLDGDEAVSRWRRSSFTVALLESQTGCVDPRYKRKEPQSSEPQSRAIQVIGLFATHGFCLGLSCNSLLSLLSQTSKETLASCCCLSRIVVSVCL